MPFELHPLGSLAEGNLGESIFRDWIGDGIQIPGSSGMSENRSLSTLNRSYELNGISCHWPTTAFPQRSFAVPQPAACLPGSGSILC